MFNEYQKEVFHSGVTITDDNKYEIAAKYVYVLTQIFSGSKPETSSYMDYKGKYRCKVLIFMDKLKDKKYRKHFDKITFVENMDFQEVIEKYDSEKHIFMWIHHIGKQKIIILITTLIEMIMKD
jgi:hypothetical protein